MIDVIKQQFNEEMSLNEKLNVTREFLQILCLKVMSDKGMFSHLAFLGGTSLRILFNLRRFSEDLDFSLTQKKNFKIDKIYDELLKSLRLNGLTIEARPKSTGAVHSMMIKFPGLLKELALSPLASQKLSIKWEVDTHPPSGWNTLTTIVNKHFIFSLVHYDLPSLFAGKLHACFYRSYTKGRDWYDFVWYLSKKVKPNLILLNNAIEQTQKKTLNLSEQNFKDYLLENIKKVDFTAVKKDVERFLEDKSELTLFEPKVLADTIKLTYE